MYTKPTRDNLRQLLEHDQEAFLDLVEDLYSTIDFLNNQLQQMSRRVQLLEDQSAKNSNNSSKPPSSDGFKRQRKTKSLRKKSGKKPGGQQGHDGSNLKMTSNPDDIIVHNLEHCQYCQESLKDVSVSDYDKRQVFDLPVMKFFIVEHRAEIKQCPCCHNKSRAAFPKAINHKTQYGTVIQSLATYLKNYQLLPYERISRLFEDLFGHRISVGTIVNFTRKCYRYLESFEKTVKQRLINSKLLNLDESGMSVLGLRHWFHVTSNSAFTYYYYHRKRGRDAMDEMGILPFFKGIKVHDHFKPYLHYGGLHSFCNAHHLRELSFIHERYDQDWALQMIKLLCRIKETVDEASKYVKHLDKKTIRNFENEYIELIRHGYDSNPPEIDKRKLKKRGPKKQSTARNLLDRLHIFRKEVLAFMYDFDIPFDNNQAERDIRMIKLQQKISGTFRSEEGPDYFCRIRSYISTSQKQKINIFDALQNAFSLQPFLP
jgi:transposase